MEIPIKYRTCTFVQPVSYICLVGNIKKPIEVELLVEAIEYFHSLPDKIQSKFLKSFDKTKVGLKGKWFKNIGDDIWEFRERDNEKIYRLFAFWDKTGEEETLIVATHGFNKKTNKTPKRQKNKAIRIKQNYFNLRK